MFDARRHRTDLTVDLWGKTLLMSGCFSVKFSVAPSGGEGLELMDLQWCFLSLDMSNTWTGDRLASVMLSAVTTLCCSLFLSCSVADWILTMMDVQRTDCRPDQQLRGRFNLLSCRTYILCWAVSTITNDAHVFQLYYKWFHLNVCFYLITTSTSHLRLSTIKVSFIMKS